MAPITENSFKNLISDEYLHLQKELHTNPNYGNASLHFGELVLEIAGNIGAKSISDYGAGKRRLYNKLLELGKKNFAYFAYDPAFPEYGPPLSADLVCCIDVSGSMRSEELPPSARSLIDSLRGASPGLMFRDRCRAKRSASSPPAAPDTSVASSDRPASRI